MPSMPRNLASLAGYAPRPISVLVQGKPSRSTSARSSAEALPMPTPPPVYLYGRLAPRSSCAAFLIWPLWPFFTGLAERCADLGGSWRVAVGRMPRRLLVGNQGWLARSLLVERVVDIEDRPGRVAPEVADVFRLQAADQGLGAVRVGGGGRGGRGRRA